MPCYQLAVNSRTVMMPLMLIMMKQATEQSGVKKGHPKKKSKERRASSAYPKVNHRSAEDDSKPLISDDAISRVSCEEVGLQWETNENRQDPVTPEKNTKEITASEKAYEISEDPKMDQIKERSKMNVTIPCVQGSSVCSYIVRRADQRCTMYLSKEGKKVALLVSKRKASSSHIVITDPLDEVLSKSSATLKSNIFNTNFTLYENNPNRSRSSSRNRLVATIVWHKNILDLKSQRKISVVVPYSTVESHLDSSDCLNRRLGGDCRSSFILRNSISDLQKGKNVQEKGFRISEKNFSLVEERNEEDIVLNFERIGKDLFCLDYTYPLSAHQAFGIALSGLLSR